MSGETESLASTSEKIATIEATIDELHRKFGVRKELFAVDANRITQYECFQRQAEVLEKCYEIQLEYNKLQSQHNWLDNTIKRMAYNEEHNYSGWGEARFYKAIVGSDAIRAYNNRKSQISVSLDALSFLTKRLEAFAELLKEIAKNKK